MLKNTIILLLALFSSACAADLNLITSNVFNKYVDTRLLKSTNPPTANALVGIRTGATNQEYKTLVAGSGVTITHSGTNITWDVTLASILADGLVSAPALSFSNSPISGLYLIDTNSIGVAVRGTNQLTISTNGITAPNVYSGTYTPDLTHGINVNITDVVPAVCQYMRVGNVVTVSGGFDVQPTAGGGTNSRLGISLPIPSELGDNYQCGGWAGNATSSICVGPISANTAADTAIWFFDSNTTILTPIWFTFTYVIN